VLQRNAAKVPNSSGLPKRPVGIAARTRSASSCCLARGPPSSNRTPEFAVVANLRTAVVRDQRRRLRNDFGLQTRKLSAADLLPLHRSIVPAARPSCLDVRSSQSIANYSEAGKFLVLDRYISAGRWDFVEYICRVITRSMLAKAVYQPPRTSRRKHLKAYHIGSAGTTSRTPDSLVSRIVAPILLCAT
jgi:hypothetical protein